MVPTAQQIQIGMALARKLAKNALRKKPRCPKCDSTQTYHRLKQKDFICQSCGNNWKKK